MRFSDQSTFANLRYFGFTVLAGILGLGNLLVVCAWLFTFYEFSTSQYRGLSPLDLLVPMIVATSVLLLRAAYRYAIRD